MCLCVYTCLQVHSCICVFGHMDAVVKIRGQFVGVTCLLILFGFGSLNSDYQAWQPAPSTTEPFHTVVFEWANLNPFGRDLVSLQIRKLRPILFQKGCCKVTQLDRYTPSGPSRQSLPETQFSEESWHLWMVPPVNQNPQAVLLFRGCAPSLSLHCKRGS